MPFNGTGTFQTLTYPDYPAVAGQLIKSSQFNNNILDLVNGLTNCLTRDGQSPPTADLPMAGKKHTNVAPAASSSDYARYDQIFRPDGATDLAGNLTIAGTSRRLLADLTNATVASRLLVQTSTTNSPSNFGVIPNGSSSVAGVSVYSGLPNGEVGTLSTTGTGIQLRAEKIGTGAYTPLSLWANGAEKFKIAADSAGTYTFGGTAPRLQADFTNGSRAARAYFQSSTVNGATTVGILPNGTATTSSLAAFNATDPDNASIAQLTCTSTEALLQASATGTGTQLPLKFNTSGTTRMTLLANAPALGLGVTPSAWTTSVAALEIKGVSVYGSSTTGVYGTNFYYDGTNYKLQSTGAALAYRQQSDKSHVWQISQSGNAGDIATWSEVYRFGPAGQLGVGGANYGTAGQVLTSGGAGAAPVWQNPTSGSTLGTSVTTTSGTTADFTGIPSWAKKITVSLVGVSTSGTSDLLVQLGAGAIENTGYVSGALRIGAAVSSTIGLLLSGGSVTAAVTHSGSLVITLVNGNTWAAFGCLAVSSGTNLCYSSAGSKTLSGVLDRIRVTTVNGTDTFDAGLINILYE